MNDLFHVRIVPWLSNLYIDEYTCVGNILKDSLVRDTNKPISLIENQYQVITSIALEI